LKAIKEIKVRVIIAQAAENVRAATIWLGDGPNSSRLVVTSDGGRTWVRAGYPASPPAP
jgi:photosystem II stability/assembly factor-like uncharacterized protein